MPTSSEVSIRVTGLGKQYRIGREQARYRTLREAIVDTVKAPFRPRSEERIIWALRDVSFDVHRGEAIGVIGRNGAGKSTLLKLLARITEPSAGEALLHGRVASLLEVGTGFHQELTGRENIFLSAAILGMRKSDIVRNFDAIVAFAEVEKFVDTPVKHYSSGMYLRLAFAVAAHLEPEILLVDEVLAVGDAQFQRKCLGKMEEVAGAGRTVLFVSHQMSAVQRLCSRAVLLKNGTVDRIGSVHEVIPAYLRSDTGHAGAREWNDPATSPGDAVVRLRAVRALDEGGRIVSERKVTDPFVLELEFDVLTPGQILDAAFYAYDEAGSIVFIAGDFQSTEWRGRERPVGRHVSRCHVPAHLLNQGQLSILAAISSRTALHALERDAITVSLMDDMSVGGARGDYSREWPGGAVRPLFRWTFDFSARENSR